MASRLPRINSRYVLLCEGQHDSQFFTHLSRQYNTIPAFEVCSVNYVLGQNHGGDTKFTEALDSLVSVPGFEMVERILIVADNDLEPKAAFANVIASIKDTAVILGPPNRRFPEPAAPMQFAKGAPGIAVYMMPELNVSGSLSTVCWQAAEQTNRASATCVNALAACTGADGWPVTTLAKMRLRSLISSTHRNKPDMSVAYVWSEGTSIVPLDSPVFHGIKDFLIGFPNL